MKLLALLESPDRTKINGKFVQWQSGTTFVVDKDGNYHEGEGTHKALAAAKNIKPDVEGRYFEVEGAVYVSLWTPYSAEGLGVLTRELPFDPPEVLWQVESMPDDQWLDYQSFAAKYREIKKFNAQDYWEAELEQARKRLALRQELHTASPGRKKAIWNELASLDGYQRPTPSPERKNGGFETEAERRFRLGESLTEGDGDPRYDLHPEPTIEVVKFRNYPALRVAGSPTARRAWFVNRAVCHHLRQEGKKPSSLAIWTFLQEHPEIPPTQRRIA